MDHNITIPIRAGQCISLLEKCPGRLGIEWAEDQCARFKIWASNLGVFSRGHASIDYRLGPGGCHDRKSYDLTFQFVDCIFQNLRLVNQVAHDPVVVQELFSPEAPSPASSDNEDEASHVGPTASPGADELALDSPVTKTEQLRVACGEVEESISRLNAVAAKVRTAGPRYREIRATKFKDIVRLETETTQDPADVTIDRTEQFKTMIAARIKYMFPEASEWLQERLSSAISLRRNYLAYLDRMTRTNSMEGVDEDEDLYDSSASETSGSDGLQDEIEPLDSAPSKADFAADGVSFVARTEASTLSFQFGEGLNIPEPKDVSEDVFMCPYCRVVCDFEDSTGKRWRNHVIADLCPYICLYEDCATPNQCYASFREWLFHMETEHVPKEWVCHSRRHPELVVFSDQHMFIKHISDSHSSSLSEAQLVALSQASSRPSCTLFEECPFGDEITDRKQSEAMRKEQVALEAGPPKSKRDDQKRILRHIGEHLQLLATMSLAWLGEETHGGGVSQDADALSSRSRVSSTPPSIPAEDKQVEEEVGLEDDPAWNEWILPGGDSKKESREAEWSLAKDGEALRIISNEVEDPVMWEFMLNFSTVTADDRQNHVLLPPEASTHSVNMLEAEHLRSRANPPEDRDSDDEKEKHRRRLFEISERLRESIQQTRQQQADATGTDTQISGPAVEEELSKRTSTDWVDQQSAEGKEEQPENIAPTKKARLMSNTTVDFIDNRLPRLHPAFSPAARYDASSQRFVFDQTSEPNKAEFQVQMEKITHEFEQFLRECLSTMPAKVTEGIMLSKIYKPVDVAAMIQDVLEASKDGNRSKLIRVKEVNRTLATVGRIWDDLSLIQQNGRNVWLNAALQEGTALACVCSALCLVISIYRSRSNTSADILAPLPDLTEAVLAGGPYEASILHRALQAKDMQQGIVSLWDMMTRTLRIHLRQESSAIWKRAVVALFIQKSPRELHDAMEELRLRTKQLSTSFTIWIEHDRLTTSGNIQNLLSDNTRRTREAQLASLKAYGEVQDIIKNDMSHVMESIYKLVQTSDNFPKLERPSDKWKFHRPPDTSLEEALARLACDDDLADIEQDTDNCLHSCSQMLGGAEYNDRLDWIMNHRKLNTWLGTPTSSFLVINGRQPAILRRGPTTTACARLYRTLRTISPATERVVISCLVGEHTSRAPVWLVRGMLGDGLRAQTGRATDADLLDSVKAARMTSTSKLCGIFSKYIKGLRKDLEVIILIDGLSFYADRERREDTALLLKCLHGLCKPLPNDTDGPVVKVLVSECGRLPSSIAPKSLAATDVLAVPDLVPTWNRGRERLLRSEATRRTRLG